MFIYSLILDNKSTKSHFTLSSYRLYIEIIIMKINKIFLITNFSIIKCICWIRWTKLNFTKKAKPAKDCLRKSK